MRKLLMFSCAILMFVMSAVAQSPRELTGKVVDDDGSGIAGVTIQIKGTTTGTISRPDGTFTLNVTNASGVLIFRQIGYSTLELTYGSSSTYTVNLKRSTTEIDEVVVPGYGSAKTVGSTVGSVAVVGQKVIAERPVANALDALQGQVAGLQVFTNSGEPSETPTFRLRGRGSLSASATPLILLDGAPIDPGLIVSLNPADYESITVLKDAAATSIYGSRAANGIIYLTSKKGSLNTPNSVNVSAQYGLNSMVGTKYFDSFMNAKELTDLWVDIGHYTRANADALLQQNPNDFRWDKFYYKDNQPMLDLNINTGGGGDRTTYYISANYFNSEGLAYRSGFDRYTLRSNVNTRVASWFRMGLNLTGGYDVREGNPYGSNNTNRALAMLAPPYFSPYDQDGNEYPDLIPGWTRYNPKYLADQNPIFQNKINLNVNSYAEFTPIKNLTIKIQPSITATDIRITSKRLPSTVTSINNGSTTEEFQRDVYRTLTNTIDYKFTVANNHGITLLAGQEFTDFNQTYTYATSSGQTDDKLTLLQHGPNARDVSSSQSQYAFRSFFGSASYNYKGKYFLDVSFRQDESSRFGFDNRTANFYSVGGMWKLTEEPFIQNISWIKNLTLRASHGTSGNANINNYIAQAQVGTSLYNNVAGFVFSQPGNTELKWESQALSSVAIQLNAFGRLDLELEWYNKLTTNMLLGVPQPYTTGFSEQQQNIGKLKNSGVELTASYYIIQNRNAYVKPRVTLSYNNEVIKELFDGKQYWIIPNTGVSWAVNQPVTFFYPIFAGIDPATGNPTWYNRDANPDNIVNTVKDPNNVTTSFNSANLEQNTGIKRYAPFIGGFGAEAGYKGFYLQTDFSFASGKYLINNDRYFFQNPNQFPGFNQQRIVKDFWQQPGDIVDYPRAGVGIWTQFDSRLIENASFMRLKILTFGYQIPQQILSKIGLVKNAKIYYSGRNLLTWTKFTGPDPEIDSNLTLGANPNTRQHSFGINVGF